mmetsp:Transcript_35177/g.78815  ORF Transcript_35177/g.78815 Transcript_35177/m.78815 type:complete len:292 (+) Transcript_35177:86-961(+)
MRFGLVCMLAVSAMDSQEDSCDDDDQLALLHLRSRLSKAKSPPLCKDVDDALWEPVCKNWRLVISEGVYAKATQVCCSAIPVPCQLPGQDCSSGEDCVSPSCHQLESYLQFYETKVVEIFGSVEAARECFFSTAKECGTKDQPMHLTHGGLERGLMATAVQEKTGDETKVVEAVESEMHEEELLQNDKGRSDGQVSAPVFASLVDRASWGARTRDVVSAPDVDNTMEEKKNKYLPGYAKEDEGSSGCQKQTFERSLDNKDDVTTSENNIARSGVTGCEEFENLIDQGPSVR